MARNNAPHRDPVCGMNVQSNDCRHIANRRGMIFYFCSQQCLERFEKTPQLYVLGQNHSSIRRHKLYFVISDIQTVRSAMANLRRLMGIQSLSSGENYIEVEYDLFQITLENIEEHVSGSGLIFLGGWQRLRRAFWKFTEENEIANLANSTGSACCNRPPPRLP